MKKFNRIVIGNYLFNPDPFCQRQFTKNAVGFVDYDIQEFETKAN